MAPETVVTIGMISTFIAVIVGSWGVFRYIGKIENKIERNRQDINNLGDVVRRKDKSILRHMNDHCTYIGDIESYLAEHMEYRPHTKRYISDEDL
ncbi:MAG: hypothetical protein F6K54_24255 [Okeania sp. SIO3B5]|uniref:hypothetical protein n=1 Tax=Okeania sp. SIO3B5 TaxID=2607811 RepID=UPI00140134CE|nr:hypothetical protein [Okeania sp. SIO3B5]NEO55903.1 hypothetical protein [Okeania sp. SIO3B5]